jgi:hypothetical protein
MQRNYNDDVLKFIDKNAYKEAYGIDLQGQQAQNINESDFENTSNAPILKEKSFLNKIWPEMQPKPKGFANSSELRKQMEELTNLAAGGPGMKLTGMAGQVLKSGLPELVEEGAKKGKEITKNTYEYLSPSKIAEETERFRKETLGAGSESENIENLSKRVQFAKKSGEEEALIPKRELYAQEGKSNVYNIKPEQLPEGNLEKMAHIIEPDMQFGKEQQNALSKALKKYRKTGNVESFIEQSEDLFGIPELSPKAASKIEDALLLPTKRESAYLSDSDVASYYGKKGKIRQLHETFSEKPTLKNYDALQSALKKEERALAKREKKGSIGDIAQAKLDQTRANISNIEEDAQNFFETLPENLRELQRTFSKKWATGPAKYADAEKTLQRLASGKQGVVTKVTSNDIVRTFTRPDEKTLAAIKEMGPSVGRNVIYSAISKIKPGEGKEVADTIIELSRKPGFENFVTDDIKAWSENMLKRTKKSELAKKGLSIGGGALAGSALGPFGTIGGALLGGTLPFAKEYIKLLPKYLQKSNT